jgi:uncharacterized BrkB/YihY/UPF0761 family membrane protein
MIASKALQWLLTACGLVLGAWVVVVVEVVRSIEEHGGTLGQFGAQVLLVAYYGLAPVSFVLMLGVVWCLWRLRAARTATPSGSR